MTFTKPIYSNEEKRLSFEWLRAYALDNESEKAACILTEIVSLKENIAAMKSTIESLADNNNQVSKQVINAIKEHIHY